MKMAVMMATAEIESPTADEVIDLTDESEDDSVRLGVECELNRFKEEIKRQSSKHQQRINEIETKLQERREQFNKTLENDQRPNIDLEEYHYLEEQYNQLVLNRQELVCLVEELERRLNVSN